MKSRRAYHSEWDPTGPNPAAKPEPQAAPEAKIAWAPASSPTELVGEDWEYGYDRWDNDGDHTSSDKVKEHNPEWIGKPCKECAFAWEHFRKPDTTVRLRIEGFIHHFGGDETIGCGYRLRGVRGSAWGYHESSASIHGALDALIEDVMIDHTACDKPFWDRLTEREPKYARTLKSARQRFEMGGEAGGYAHDRQTWFFELDFEYDPKDEDCACAATFFRGDKDVRPNNFMEAPRIA